MVVSVAVGSGVGGKTGISSVGVGTDVAVRVGVGDVGIVDVAVDVGAGVLVQLSAASATARRRLTCFNAATLPRVVVLKMFLMKSDALIVWSCGQPWSHLLSESMLLNTAALPNASAPLNTAIVIENKPPRSRRRQNNIVSVIDYSNSPPSQNRVDSLFRASHAAGRLTHPTMAKMFPTPCYKASSGWGKTPLKPRGEWQDEEPPLGSVSTRMGVSSVSGESTPHRPPGHHHGGSDGEQQHEGYGPPRVWLPRPAPGGVACQ